MFLTSRLQVARVGSECTRERRAPVSLCWRSSAFYLATIGGSSAVSRLFASQSPLDNPAGA